MMILAKVFASIAAALLLTGCLEHSISGTYVSHQSSGAELLQLTQTPDHHLVGTIQRATLSPDGHVATTTVNVTGVVDGENLTLTVFNSLLPIGDNFGGTVTSGGLDLTVPARSGSTQTGTSHFDRGTQSDYDAAVSKLVEAGSVTQAQHQRDQQVNALDREADLLTQNLNEFVTHARYMIEQQTRVVDYYTKAVPEQQARLDLARRLATGNGFQQGQAQMVIGQMSVARAAITSASDGVDRAHKENADREAMLNIGIQRFTGICLGDTATRKPGELIPDMGPCKSLGAAVTAYKTILGPLHSTRDTVLQAKTKGLQQLSQIWRTASTVH